MLIFFYILTALASRFKKLNVEVISIKIIFIYYTIFFELPFILFRHLYIYYYI